MRVHEWMASGLAVVCSALLVSACQAPAPEPAAEPVDHAATLQGPTEAFAGAWQTGNTDALDEIVDPSFERRAPAGGSASGPEELKARINEFHAAYPDMDLTIDDIYYLENTAIVRWTFRGTNTGPGPGEAEPTGNAVEVSGMTEARFVDGKVVLEDVYFDSLSWMEQLGFSLAPGADGS